MPLSILGPVTVFAAIIVARKALETFDTVHILTQSGPDRSSSMLPFTLYRKGVQYLLWLLAAASIVFLLIAVALGALHARGRTKGSPCITC